jgi:hypothetical protein
MKISKLFKILRLGHAVFILLFALTGCKTYNRLHFQSIDNNQSITIITKGDIQYLIVGKHYKVPDSNYVKLDISKIDLAGGLYLCWNPNNRYNWDAVIYKARILECKLDTTKYRFNTLLPLDTRNIPSALKFEDSNCIQYDLTSGQAMR